MKKNVCEDTLALEVGDGDKSEGADDAVLLSAASPCTVHKITPAFSVVFDPIMVTHVP